MKPRQGLNWDAASCKEDVTSNPGVLFTLDFVSTNFGRGSAILLEHPIHVMDAVKVQWKTPGVNLMELADKYWIQKWSYQQIGEHYGLATETTRRKIIRLRVAAKNGEQPWISFLVKEEGNE